MYAVGSEVCVWEDIISQEGVTPKGFFFPPSLSRPSHLATLTNPEHVHGLAHPEGQQKRAKKSKQYPSRAYDTLWTGTILCMRLSCSATGDCLSNTAWVCRASMVLQPAVAQAARTICTSTGSLS